MGGVERSWGGIYMYLTILVCSMADLVVGAVAIVRSGAVGVLRKVAVPVEKRVARAGWLAVMIASYSSWNNLYVKRESRSPSQRDEFVWSALKCKVDDVIIKGPAQVGSFSPRGTAARACICRSLVRRVPSHAASRPACLETRA